MHVSRDKRVSSNCGNHRHTGELATDLHNLHLIKIGRQKSAVMLKARVRTYRDEGETLLERARVSATIASVAAMIFSLDGSSNGQREEIRLAKR